MFSEAAPFSQIPARARKPLVVGVLAAIPIIIMAFGFVLLRQFDMADHFRQQVERSHERRALILQILSAHQDLETGARGFLITNQEAFLDPYRSAHERIHDSIARLRPMLVQPQSLRDLSQIEQLSAQKQTLASKGIDLVRAGKADTAIELVRSGAGKMVMDAIRDRVQSLIGRENAEIATASSELQRASSQLKVFAFSLLSMLLLLLTLAGIYISRALEARRVALSRWHDASQRREAILNSAMDAIFTLNPSGSIESVNHAATTMFGYDAEDLVRRDVGMLFDPPRPIGAVAQALRDMHLEDGRPGETRELQALRKDGTSFPSDVGVTIMRLERGASYVAVVRDISERKRVEQLKSEFVSTVSHELRTPLTSIAGALGLLAGGAAGELPPRSSQLIDIARKNADRLVRLINDILDIEKIESGRMHFDNRELGLRELVEEAIAAGQGYADGFGISVGVTGGEDARVHADPDRLTQVMTNLIANAVKFSPPGGSVEVVIAPGELTHRISVRDHGKGIPESFRSRIFGKFAQADGSDTRQKGGTGLGLSIVREIVTRLGGRISYDSIEGQGTTFHVDLPNPAIEATAPIAARRTILLVGGPGEVAGEIEKVLAGRGFAIARTASSQEALRAMDVASFTAVMLLREEDDEDALARIAEFRARLASEGVPIISVRDVAEQAGSDGDRLVVLDLRQRPPSVEALVRAVDEVARFGERLPRVLHVDDDPDILSVVAAALKDHATVLSTRSIAAARAVLRTTSVDLAILDLTLEDGCGTELIPDLERREGEPVQTIIFSAQDCDGQTARAVSAHFVKAGTPLNRLVEAVGHLAERRRGEAKEAA